MTADTDEMIADLSCAACGYDLRAQPGDGKCPECSASVAESRRLATLPRRPAWRDSDPRWRRRMVAGVWVLVLLPLLDVLQYSNWAERIPVPEIFDYRGSVGSLDRTLLATTGLYEALIFCMGVVLLFSKERGRRLNRLDWTRRWGVLCSYVTLLLSFTGILLIASLVLVGITALFLSMPLQHQPRITNLFGQVSTAYLSYGPSPKEITVAVRVGFSSVMMLFACVALFDALRRSGSKAWALALVVPLGLFALMHLAVAAGYCLGILSYNQVSAAEIYFNPQLLLQNLSGFPGSLIATGTVMAFFIEAAKWCIVLTIAAWLTDAQVAAWWKPGAPRGA
jgi:hypothetical protein